MAAYADVRNKIETGDVLLFRGSGLLSCVIKRRTRSVYSHAGLAIWIGARLMLAESVEGRGVRLVPLSSVAESATFDVYSPYVPMTRDEATRLRDKALSMLGQAYGWREIFKIAASKIPGWPIKTWSENDNDETTAAPICSQYVSICYRSIRRDLVPNLSDHSTTPGDLARSSSLRRVAMVVHKSK